MSSSTTDAGLSNAAALPGRTRRRLRTSARGWLTAPQVITPVVSVALWELAGRSLTGNWFPPASSVGAAWWALAREGAFLSLTSTGRTLGVGLVITFVVAGVLTVLLSASRVLEDAAEPFVNAALATPTIALIPVYIMIWGFKDGTRIATVVSFALFPVVVTWVQAVKDTPQDLLEMATAFTAGRLSRVRRVVLPSAAPLLVTGVRIGVMQGIKGVVSAEVLVGIIGVGRLLQDYAYNMPRLYAVVVTLLAVSIAAYLLLFTIDQRVSRRSSDG